MMNERPEPKRELSDVERYVLENADIYSGLDISIDEGTGRLTFHLRRVWGHYQYPRIRLG